MELGLRNKVALVTGASRGIGQGIAMSLADEGCDVMLTGRAPDVYSALRPPRGIRPEIPKAIAAVCLKAMAADLAQRYDDVPALEREVVRYLNGQPVEAYPESILERALRVGRKYRIPILLVLAYLLMRIVLLIARAQ